MKYLKLSSCKHLEIYAVKAQNFKIAVFNKTNKEFYGLRIRFSAEVISSEKHYDQHGTVKPYIEIGKCKREIFEDKKHLLRYFQELNKALYLR